MNGYHGASIPRGELFVNRVGLGYHLGNSAGDLGYWAMRPEPYSVFPFENDEALPDEMLDDDAFSGRQHRLEVKDKHWRLAWFVKELAFGSVVVDPMVRALYHAGTRLSIGQVWDIDWEKMGGRETAVCGGS